MKWKLNHIHKLSQMSLFHISRHQTSRLEDGQLYTMNFGVSQQKTYVYA